MIPYCLFCRTQRSQIISTYLERTVVDRAFAPQIVQRQFKQGVSYEKESPLLPGYVFLYMEKPILDFYRVVQGIDGVIRYVGNREEDYILQGGDADFAMHLLERDGVVGKVKVHQAGELIRLSDPLFNGCQGEITKVDFRKQRARVDFLFDNNHCHTWVSFDAIEEKKTPLEL